MVTYPINGLEEGSYTLDFKAWDINSNSAEKTINFIVASDAKIALQNVMNFPNPFNYETTFSINHNRAGEDLEVKVLIYSVKGELLTELSQVYPNSTARLNEMVWDGSNSSR